MLELVLYGSHARCSTTGYSDVDAILVISDAAANDGNALRKLRRRVLAAQRAVVAHQPMQHHGFEVMTPRLLEDSAAALALPAEAVEETRSVFGNAIRARFAPIERETLQAFRALASTLLSVESWPKHPWHVHRLVAMFELLPTLYLQATSRPTAKSRSFSLARTDFPSDWRPYDILNDVRLVWPRTRRPGLELAMTASRNPWAAVAAWRRLPIALSPTVAPLLDQRTLDELQRIASLMVEVVGD